MNQVISSQTKLKIAFIGGGKMAVKHMQAIKHINIAKIISVADPNVNKETIEQVTGQDINFYSSAEEMFNTEDIDIVHIVTPKGTHFKLAELALKNGANVYVEKPFTETSEEAKKIFELAQANNLKVCPGHQLLFQKPAVLATDLVKLIGSPIYFESYFSFRTARKSISPIDQLLDILPHPTYTLLHFIELMTDSDSKIEIKSKDVNINGEALVSLKKGNINSILNVTLNGRPVDSYLKITGTNGSLHLDFVRDILVKNIGPGADALSAVFSPYSQALQLFWKSTKSFANLALGKNHSYPGLFELISDFYGSIKDEKKFTISSQSVVDSVKIYETIRNDLSKIENKIIAELRQQKLPKNVQLSKINTNKDSILLTGGTGFLGKIVAKTLRSNGHRVKIVARNTPSDTRKLQGVEYCQADLGGEIPDEVFDNINCVVHCAAETSGGKDDHVKNSIEATKKLYEKALNNRVEKFIHTSSIAVLKTGSMFSRAISEKTQVDSENEGRGPYVWGKAQSEKILKQISDKSDLKVKILRPGPLVDYENFEAPGRLGKQIGQRFIIMGSKRSNLSVCDVNSTARIIQYYINNYSEAPDILNVVDPETPNRGDLINMLSKNQPGLKTFYMPSSVVSLISFSLRVVMRIIHPTKKALNIKAAFASEKYDTSLVEKISMAAKKNN